MFNVDNYGVVTGRLTDDIRYYPNPDGSRRLMMTIAVQNSYKSRDGYKAAQFIPLSAFLPSHRPDGIFAYMHKGDKVTIQYSVRNNNYVAKDGRPVYALELTVEDVRLQEPKSVTTARHAASLAAATA